MTRWLCPSVPAKACLHLTSELLSGIPRFKFTIRTLLGWLDFLVMEQCPVDTQWQHFNFEGVFASISWLLWCKKHIKSLSLKCISLHQFVMSLRLHKPKGMFFQAYLVNEYARLDLDKLYKKTNYGVKMGSVPSLLELRQQVLYTCYSHCYSHSCFCSVPLHRKNCELSFPRFITNRLILLRKNWKIQEWE